MLINVNGQSYTSWEDVPPEVRQQLATTLPDADKNGVPDLFEGNLQGLPAGAQTFASTSIIVDGKPVQSAAQLSPEVQAKLQQALGMLGPMFAAGTTPAAAPGAPATPAATATSAIPLQPGQVMLNGVPTVVGGTPPPKKGFFKRLFGG
ncbi:MAG: hypothetical protein QOF53_754 [Nocardioidaceae bacterium]|jgi:hypothetical protein|nr:hypothetical protein [Nocardioidaceae bacterium]